MFTFETCRRTLNNALPVKHPGDGIVWDCKPPDDNELVDELDLDNQPWFHASSSLVPRRPSTVLVEEVVSKHVVVETKKKRTQRRSPVKGQRSPVKGRRSPKQAKVKEESSKSPRKDVTRGNGVVRRLQISTEGFWEFLFSDHWEDSCLLRVLQGELLDNLLYALHLLESKYEVISYVTITYVNIPPRRVKFSSMKNAAAGGTGLETGTQEVLVELDYFGPNRKPMTTDGGESSQRERTRRDKSEQFSEADDGKVNNIRGLKQPPPYSKWRAPFPTVREPFYVRRDRERTAFPPLEQLPPLKKPDEDLSQEMADAACPAISPRPTDQPDLVRMSAEQAADIHDCESFIDYVTCGPKDEDDDDVVSKDVYLEPITDLPARLQRAMEAMGEKKPKETGDGSGQVKRKSDEVHAHPRLSLALKEKRTSEQRTSTGVEEAKMPEKKTEKKRRREKPLSPDPADDDLESSKHEYLDQHLARQRQLQEDLASMDTELVCRLPSRSPSLNDTSRIFIKTGPRESLRARIGLKGPSSAPSGRAFGRGLGVRRILSAPDGGDLNLCTPSPDRHACGPDVHVRRLPHDASVQKRGPGGENVPMLHRTQRTAAVPAPAGPRPTRQGVTTQARSQGLHCTKEAATFPFVQGNVGRVASRPGVHTDHFVQDQTKEASDKLGETTPEAPYGLEAYGIKHWRKCPTFSEYFKYLMQETEAKKSSGAQKHSSLAEKQNKHWSAGSGEWREKSGEGGDLHKKKRTTVGARSQVDKLASADLLQQAGLQQAGLVLQDRKWHISVRFAFLAGGVCDSVGVRNALLERRSDILEIVKDGIARLTHEKSTGECAVCSKRIKHRKMTSRNKPMDLNRCLKCCKKLRPECKDGEEGEKTSHKTARGKEGTAGKNAGTEKTSITTEKEKKKGQTCESAGKVQIDASGDHAAKTESKKAAKKKSRKGVTRKEEEELFKSMGFREIFDEKALKSSYSFEKMFAHQRDTIPDYKALLSRFSKPFKGRRTNDPVRVETSPWQAESTQKVSAGTTPLRAHEQGTSDADKLPQPPTVLGKLREFKFLKYRDYIRAPPASLAYTPPTVMSADQIRDRLVEAMKVFVVRKERATTTRQFQSKVTVTFTRRQRADGSGPCMADAERVLDGVCQTIVS